MNEMIFSQGTERANARVMCGIKLVDREKSRCLSLRKHWLSCKIVVVFKCVDMC